MHSKTLMAALRVTIPVFIGYLALGLAFGLLMAAAGYGPGWAFFMSIVVYAGSAQIMGVALLAAGASLGEVTLLTLALNFRHVVYGLSMLEKFKGMGWRKPYMIFSLTDETYALLASLKTPEGLDEKNFLFTVAALDHSYWVFGSTLGATLGSALGTIPPGVEFAMTALFVVIAVGQWKGTKDHVPALLGLGVTLVCRLLLGTGNTMLVCALAVIVVTLSLRGGRAPVVEKEKKKEGVL